MGLPSSLTLKHKSISETSSFIVYLKASLLKKFALALFDVCQRCVEEIKLSFSCLNSNMPKTREANSLPSYLAA